MVKLLNILIVFSLPIEIMKGSKDGVLYSNKEIQDYNATTCGWFINMVSKNTSITDKILFLFVQNKRMTT